MEAVGVSVFSFGEAEEEGEEGDGYEADGFPVEACEEVQEVEGGVSLAQKEDDAPAEEGEGGQVIGVVDGVEGEVVPAHGDEEQVGEGGVEVGRTRLSE